MVRAPTALLPRIPRFTLLSPPRPLPAAPHPSAVYPPALIVALANDQSRKGLSEGFCVNSIVTSDHTLRRTCLQGDVDLLVTVVSALLFLTYSVGTPLECAPTHTPCASGWGGDATCFLTPASSSQGTRV